MESLAIAYRPRTFDDLIGQKAVQVLLRQMLNLGRVPTALLFAGPRGVGKTTTARIFAAAVNCEQPDAQSRPCTQCVACKSIQSGNSLDIHEIDAASHGLVDDIRALNEQVLYGTGGNYRVVVLDEAQSISSSGFNALLKTLEQPPLNTVFILCTTEPTKIPTTVTSRCMPFQFNRVGIAHIVTRLQQICTAEHIEVEPALLTAIAERSDGGMRDAVMLLDQMTRVGITTMPQFLDLFGDTDLGPAVIGKLVAGDTAGVFATVTEQLHHTGDARAIADNIATTLRDLLVLRSGGTLHQQGSALAQRQQLADRLDAGTIVAALRVLWDYKTKIRSSEDPAVALDLTLVMLGTALHRPTTAAATPTTTGSLTLAQMAAGTRR